MILRVQGENKIPFFGDFMGKMKYQTTDVYKDSGF